MIEGKINVYYGGTIERASIVTEPEDVRDMACVEPYAHAAQRGDNRRGMLYEDDAGELFFLAD